MSILAKNLKTIRKELGCTQYLMANILNVGFRTFVRYEAGERDAPVEVLVKIARLGNISLESFLTKSIKPNDIAPLEKINKGITPVKIKFIDFKAGNITFLEPNRPELMTINDSEKHLLTIFRKMSPRFKKDLTESMNQTVATGRVINQRLEKTNRGEKVKLTKIPKVKMEAKNSLEPKTKRKPGRKKIDKKALQEKIDRLKMGARNINKITVR